MTDRPSLGIRTFPARGVFAEISMPADSRDRIMEAVRRQPGLPVGSLREACGLGWGTIYHHLRRLAQEGHVRTEVAGRRLLVFLAEEQDAALARAYDLLRGATARRIAIAIMERPGCSIEDIVQASGETPRVVYYHVKRLKEEALVRSTAPRRHFGLHAAAALPTLLESTHE